MSHNSELYTTFNEKNLGKFIEKLEVYGTDPNYKIEAKDYTIFEHILSTPGSKNFIKACVQHGADFNMVSIDLEPGAYSWWWGGCLGVPPLFENFFKFSRVLKKKIPKPPSNNFWISPCIEQYCPTF